MILTKAGLPGNRWNREPLFSPLNRVAETNYQTLQMAAPRLCGHFLSEVPMAMDNSDQVSAQAETAAKVGASIIIAGILAMFTYGILHWVIFE